jgi:hypothetical protein
LSGFSAAGSFVYTPTPGYAGSDSFTVTATDAGGSATTGTIAITVVADPGPTVGNTIVSASGAALASINVLANSSSPVKEALKVTVTPNTTLVGTATVNSDQSVSVTGLPANFKGLTRFQYTVTDQSGKSGNGSAAVFVGSAPFRAAFVADSASAGAGSYEVYLTDFAANPVKESAATSGTVRLQGFAISDNGATVVYRSLDPSNAASNSLSFVRTATPATQVPISLPGAAVPVADANGADQFVISPDGKWIAIIAGSASSNSLYLLSAANPSAVTQIVPTIPGVAPAYASQPTFTLDSQSVYFLASGSGGAHRSLYLVALGNLGTPVLVSKQSDPATSDDVSAYSVAPDQTAIVEQANRNGREGIWYINPKTPGTESEIDQPAAGVAVTWSTVGLKPGFGGSNTGQAVAYDVGIPVTSPDSVGIYAAANLTKSAPSFVPQFITPLETVVGFSPDDSKLLVTDGSLVSEIGAGAGNTTAQIGVGNKGWYDSSGNIVLIQNPLSSGVSLTYTTRTSATGSFVSPLPVNTQGTAVYSVDVSAFSQGVVLLAEAQSGAAAPTTADLQLINVLANPQPLYLSSLAATPSSQQSPTHLTSYVSRIVTQ